MGGGGEELDDNVKIVDAIEHTSHLQEYEMSATALKTYLKSYYQAMRKAKKEAGVPQDEIKAFMATAPTACKFLLTRSRTARSSSTRILMIRARSASASGRSRATSTTTSSRASSACAARFYVPLG